MTVHDGDILYLCQEEQGPNSNQRISNKSLIAAMQQLRTPSVANYRNIATTHAHGKDSTLTSRASVTSLASLALRIEDVEEDLYFRESIKDSLGAGGYAGVEKVVHKISRDVFARKYYDAAGDDGYYRTHQFLTEVKIIKRLSGHHHIIEYIESYRTGNQLCLILLPVADSRDLATYLRRIRSRPAPTSLELKVLLRATGCLASALAFIHKKNIRYKDIKPENILIHQGTVVFTDFGTAIDGADYATTTDGILIGSSPRYDAPESAPGAPRDFKTDIFSLGCVYYEILSVLEPVFLPYTLLSTMYSENIENILSTQEKNYTYYSRYSRIISKIACSMIRHINEERPTADDVELYFVDASRLGTALLCNKCKTPEQVKRLSLPNSRSFSIPQPIPYRTNRPFHSDCEVDIETAREQSYIHAGFGPSDYIARLGRKLQQMARE
jgi:serine/threonine protein kinase